MIQQKPPRTPWDQFPDVVIHAAELTVKRHPLYAAAMAGDSDAAFLLVRATIAAEALTSLQLLIRDRRPTLVSAHALEQQGTNAIPEPWRMSWAEEWL